MLKQLKGVGSTYRANERRRRRRFVRLIIGVCVILIVIGTLIGLVYVWWMGKTRPVQQAAAPTTTTAKVTSTPVSVDENAPVGVAVQAITSPVTRGGNSSISIRTRPKAACSIRVTYSLTPDQAKESKDGGLIPKTADEYGTVSWTWTVESSRPAGSWPVEVTCAYKDKWGYGKGAMEVIE